MLKKITILLLVAILIVAMGMMSCKSGSQASTETTAQAGTENATGETATTKEAAEQGEVVSIRFATDESDASSAEAFKFAIEEYEALHPNVKISLELVSPPGSYITYLSTNVAGNNAPNIAKTYVDMPVQFKDNLLVLNDVVEQLGGEEVFFEGSLVKIDGDNYFLPYGSGGMMMYVRTDLFEKYGVKIPETTDEWLEAAEKLTLDTDGDGVIDIYGTVISAFGGGDAPSAHEWQTWMWQQGYAQFDENYNPTVNNEGLVNALTLMKEVSKYCPPGIAEYGWYEMMDSYASGRVASTFYFGRLLNYLRTNAPDLLPVTKAIPMPIIDNGVRCSIGEFEGYSVFRSDNEKENETAKDFLMFLLDGERISKFMLTVPGHIGATRTNVDLSYYYEDPFVIENKENIDFMLKDLPNYFMFNRLDSGAKIVDGKMTLMEGAQPHPYYLPILSNLCVFKVVENVILDVMTPQEAAEWLQLQYEEVIKQQEELQ